jgi:hypothetical protein
MHYDACQRMSAEVIDSRLADEIGKLKNLTVGASAAGCAYPKPKPGRID